MRVYGNAAVITDVVLSDNEWIILNYDHTGYYRINYSPTLWQLIIHQLNTDHQVQQHFIKYLDIY